MAQNQRKKAGRRQTPKAEELEETSSTSPAPEPEPEPELEDDGPPEPTEEELNPKPRTPQDRIPTATVRNTEAIPVGGLRNQSQFNPTKMAEERDRSTKLAGVAAELSRTIVDDTVPSLPNGDDPQWVYFIRCPQRHCSGPGIFIHKLPSGELGPQDWEASYKPRESEWPAHELWCQCCYERDGRRVKLPVFHQNSRPFINQRHVGKISRAEFEKLTQRVEVEA